MTITSQHNQKLKEIRKLQMRKRERDRSGRFVAEGEDLLAAADAAGWKPLERFCAAGSGLAGMEVEPALLTRGSGLASGTRALAVYQEHWLPQPQGPLCVYLHGVHDPGNVGTILRSAAAFGASSVAFGPGTADPFSPKAVRASMGAVFAVPVARADAVAAPAALPGRTVAVAARRGTPLSSLAGPAAQPGAAEREAVTLMIGGEREGLPAAVLAAAAEVVHIPVAIESLNAAMAATVALYEATRMRRE